jgi:hypothetical protein
MAAADEAPGVVDHSTPLKILLNKSCSLRYREQSVACSASEAT